MECLTCKRQLNNDNDLLSCDCGGDCLLCMADFGDTECLNTVIKIKDQGRINEQDSARVTQVIKYSGIEDK